MMSEIRLRKVLVICSGVLLVGALTAVVVAFKADSTTTHRSAVFHLGSKGTPITVSAKQRRLLSGLPTKGAVSLIAVRGARAFYQIGNANCFARGDANEIGIFSFVGCTDGTSAVADMSIVDITAAGGPRFITLEGIAAKQVDQVVLEAANGSAIARAPVVDGVYAITSIPAEPAAKITAKDTAGNAISSTRLP